MREKRKIITFIVVLLLYLISMTSIVSAGIMLGNIEEAEETSATNLGAEENAVTADAQEETINKYKELLNEKINRVKNLFKKFSYSDKLLSRVRYRLVEGIEQEKFQPLDATTLRLKKCNLLEAVSIDIDK